ncbi:DUF2264 domain-containing protein [Marispirochaeta aestuarii]|uniref:DUF2264 domain-containing protein n=1 Tax=Marispirochaeta aestuarii TaxID=1963862 RepID=UPI0029C91128|nr:DUF2264 domain-containing protein [Marispirochaeta aestuarii]
MYYEKLRNNPVKTFSDLEQALLDSVEPYLAYVSPGFARIEAGPSGATFNTKAVQLEGFARLLWGLVPYLAGRNKSRNTRIAYPDQAGFDFIEFVNRGIRHGVDPEHNEFWGVPGDYDQLLVEMAVFGYALLLIPEIIWEPLDSESRKNLSRWLSYINIRQIPDCNWVFFRILVNCGLERVGAEGFDKELLHESLLLAEQFYLTDAGDGWYNDGFPSQRRARDYYIPWAMHYYGLIFAGCCGDLYPMYAGRYRERALLFAEEFSRWFAEDGAALPFGRSLTYRFAQGAFWGAMPFALEKSAYDWGKAKTLFLRNLRWWFGQPAYSETGLLSVGYTYPNQYMAERYNSPNSPLWALKAFIPMALSKTHPFWQAAEFSTGEADLTKSGKSRPQKSSGFYICSDADAGHLYVLNSGQWTPGTPNEHLHMAEKYAKFAYSASFAFNVCTDTYGIDKLAPDNMLLVSDGEEFYRYRTESSDHQVTDAWVFSRWKPYRGVEIATWLGPVDQGRWHLRVHKVKSDRPLKTVEGGFPLPYGDEFYPLPDDEKRKSVGESSVSTGQGSSRIVDFGAHRNGLLVTASPNSNIMHPRVIIPTLTSEHAPGEFWLACLVHAHPDPKVTVTVPRFTEALEAFPATVRQKLLNIGDAV